jgi:pheromone shutdown-related protein TraB
MEENPHVHRLSHDGKEIILVGTAHVSKKSADLVRSVILEEEPDVVCVELCESRLKSIREKDRWRDMDIIKVIKEKKTFLILANLILASFQKKIGKKLDATPGGEMTAAIEAAGETGARIETADRDIRITLSRAWRALGFWDKIKMLFHLVMSSGEMDKITEEDIEKMKDKDALDSILSEIGESAPALRAIIIDERDRFLAHRIQNAEGKKIVAVAGAGHVPGIKTHIGSNAGIEGLETVPAKTRLSAVVKWGLPLAILGLFAWGFFAGGARAGGDMIMWWVIANGVMAALGAMAALARPATILSAVVAAPLTSLNPMIAAGWVAGLVEAFSSKPKVRDFETLPDDILSIKGFWKNKVTRILLVVVFTNIGSAAGTLIAIPILMKIL